MRLSLFAEKVLYYLPRFLSVLIVGFLSMFIGEGLDPDFTWFDSLMHLVLALVVLGITILAWKKPKLGGWVFIAIGIFYIVSVIQARWYGGLFIGSIPLVVGIMFLLPRRINIKNRL